MLMGKLDARGYLSLLRNGTMKDQWCPYNNEQDGMRCGDWCPLFEVSELYFEFHCSNLRRQINKEE